MNSLNGKYDGYKLNIQFKDEISKETYESLSKIIESELERYGQVVERTNPESEVSKFNSSLNNFSGSREFFDYFSDAIHWFGITDGIFNPFVVSVLDDIKQLKVNSPEWKGDSLFKLNTVKANFPKNFSELSKFLQIDYTNYQIKILRPVSLDLSGLSKGKFVDKLSRKLSRDLNHYSIQFGGDSFFKTSAKELPWRVKISNPVTREKGIVTIEATDEAISISGKLGQKKILSTGEEYILLNPDSQIRVENNLAMVVIKSDQASKTDVLAKTFFIANEDQRTALSKKFPEIYRIEIDQSGKLTIF